MCVASGFSTVAHCVANLYGLARRREAVNEGGTALEVVDCDGVDAPDDIVASSSCGECAGCLGVGTRETMQKRLSKSATSNLMS